MAEDLAPEVLPNDALQDLFDGLDNAEDGTVPRQKWTVQDVVDAGDEQQRMKFARIVRIIPNGPPTRKKRILQLMHEFIKLHQHPKGLKNGKLAGKERRKKGIAGRVCSYLTIRMERSAKRDQDGMIIPHPKTGKPQYCGVLWLRRLGDLCLAMLRLLPYPAMTATELLRAKRVVHSHINGLRDAHDLKREKRKRVTLYAADVRNMIELAFEICGDKYDIDIVFRASRDEAGNLLGYDVLLTLTSFKGFHVEKSLSITFNVRTVVSAKNGVLDLGTWLLAHGMRGGAFGTRELEDILESDMSEFKCDPSFDDEPVFVSRGSRSSLTARPLNADKATRAFRDLLRATGASTGEKYSETLYCLRRGFASTMTKNMGAPITKWFLGHRADSTMLEDNYDHSRVNENISAGVLGQAERQEMVFTPLTFKAAQYNIAATPRVTLEEALKVHPEFRHFQSKKIMLESCLLSGSGHWKTVEPFKSNLRSTEMSQANLPIIIARYRHRLRRIVESVRRAQYENSQARQQAEVDELDYQTIRDRADNAEKPSKLALELQKRLLERERAVVEDPTAPAEEVDREIEVTLDDDEEDEEGDVEDAIDEEEEDDDDEEEGEGEGEGAQRRGADDDEEVDAEGIGLEEELGEYNDEGRLDDEVGEASEVLEDEEDDDAAGVDHGTEEADEHVADEDVEMSEQVVDDGVDLDAEEGAQEQDEEIVNDVVVQKMTTLKALVALMDGTGSERCDKCIKDTTVTRAQRIRRWPTSQKARKERHMVQFHAPYRQANRWIKMNVKEGECFSRLTPSLHVFICPFVEGEGTMRGPETPSVKCSHKSAGNTKGTMKLSRARKHIVTRHPLAFTPAILAALDPDTRIQSRADTAAIQGTDMKKRRLDKVKFMLPPHLVDNYAQDGYMAQFGLGTSIIGTELVSYEADSIPEGFVREDGSLDL